MEGNGRWIPHSLGSVRGREKGRGGLTISERRELQDLPLPSPSLTHSPWINGKIAGQRGWESVRDGEGQRRFSIASIRDGTGRVAGKEFLRTQRCRYCESVSIKDSRVWFILICTMRYLVSSFYQRPKGFSLMSNNESQIIRMTKY